MINLKEYLSPGEILEFTVNYSKEKMDRHEGKSMDDFLQPHNHFSSMLNHAFEWESTPQKHDYWAHIRNRKAFVDKGVQLVELGNFINSYKIEDKDLIIYTDTTVVEYIDIEMVKETVKNDAKVIKWDKIATTRTLMTHYIKTNKGELLWHVPVKL